MELMKQFNDSAKRCLMCHRSAAVSAVFLYNSLNTVKLAMMLFALEGDDVYVSAGSACSSRKQKISPVLKAMGISTARADCSLRFSLSRETTEEEIRYAAERVAVRYEELRRFVRR